MIIMGVRSCLSVSLWVLLIGACASIVLPVSGGKSGTLCDVPGCKCTTRTSWKLVNCTLAPDQDVHIMPGNVSANMVEFFIEGGQTLILSSRSFSSLPGLDILHINGAKYISMETESFYDITSASLRIKIENCDQLKIKTGAFDETVQATIETEILRTTSVHIAKEAFSRYTSGIFQQISHLKLDEEAFKLKHQILRRHGVATNISFNSSVIPDIPNGAFASTLATVEFVNSKIGTIHIDAFRASVINEISIVNTSIERVLAGAFSSMTFISLFTISRCNIQSIDSGAVRSGIQKLTVEHSKITDIQPESINTIAATVEIIGNRIEHFGSHGFIIKEWSKISMEQNIIIHLQNHFLQVSSEGPDTMNQMFSFVDNDIQMAEPGALAFMSEIGNRATLTLDNNFFNSTCRCAVGEWMFELSNTSVYTSYLADTSFCTANDILVRCYKLQQGLINIQNFTQMVCNQSDQIYCEEYIGEPKFVNVTSNMFSENDSHKTSWLILITTVIGLAILSIIATFVFLLLKGGRWLKRNGYFRNIHYNQNERSNDEENTIVTVDENEPLEIPEELSFDFLQQLRKRLDDPNTKEEATEMIERLYEMFIVEDSYENNNRQDEEAHLYEELGNLQQQLQQLDQEPDKLQNYDGPMSILRLMEEKFNNIHAGENETGSRPALAGEYSEPSDAAVHLYSELQQARENEENENRDSLKSRSSNMSIRPLPDKPADNNVQMPGPSK